MSIQGVQIIYYKVKLQSGKKLCNCFVFFAYCLSHQEVFKKQIIKQETFYLSLFVNLKLESEKNYVILFVYISVIGDLLLSFSLIKNVKKMISLERSSSDITAVHLIRLVNALLLLVAHKCMAIFFVPYTNRTEMSEVSLLINYLPIILQGQVCYF